MAEDKELVTIKKSTLQWLVIVVIALAVGGLAGRYIFPATGAAAGNQNIAPSQPSAPGGNPVAGPVKFDVSVDDDPTLGNKDAKVTIIEFSDFQCPFCGRFYTQTELQLKKDYVDTGKVLFVYRDFPLSSIHPNAQKAAEASECADEQGKFWEYHDLLFTKQDPWADTDGITAFKQYAKDLGLNTGQFNSCLDTGKYASEVDKDFQDGSNAGVSGTPSFFINGQQVVGAQPYSVFKQMIDSELAA